MCDMTKCLPTDGEIMRTAPSVHDSAQTLVFPAFGAPRTATEAAIRVYARESWTVLEASGELGWTVTRALRDLVRSTSSSRLIFDLRRVTYMDHNSLAVLAHAHRTKRSLGGAARLVEPPRSTRTLLRISRAFELPPVFDTFEDAIS